MCLRRSSRSSRRGTISPSGSPDEAVAAENFTAGGDLLGHARGEELGDRGFGDERLPAFQAGGVVDEHAGGFELGCRSGELMLHGLELRDRLAELSPLLCVFDGVDQAPWRGRSSARRCRCGLRSASRSRPCSPCLVRRGRSRQGRGSLRTAARRCCWRGCRACPLSCLR